jgi:hypothetical protein
MRRALLLLLILSCISATTALADDTVFFWSCDAAGGYCYQQVYPYSDGFYWFGGGELTVFGQCTGGGAPQASEAIGWAYCTDPTIDGLLTAWASYVNTTPNELGYVISDGVIYRNPGTGAEVAWERWYRRYCDGTYISNEPPAMSC